jgi:hypothetical protein
MLILFMDLIDLWAVIFLLFARNRLDIDYLRFLIVVDIRDILLVPLEREP